MADIKIPAIKPPSAPWAISFGEFMSNAQAIITPDKTPTNAKIIHINKAQPLFHHSFIDSAVRIVKSLSLEAQQIITLDHLKSPSSSWTAFLGP